MSRGCAVPKNPRSAPSGRSTRVNCVGERLRRPPIQIVDQIPAEDAVDRWHRPAGSGSSRSRQARPPCRSRTWRSRSAKMSSTKILHPSCSPRYVTLLPTTGPRSSRTGERREVNGVRNFASALVAKTGSSTTALGAGGGPKSARRAAMIDRVDPRMNWSSEPDVGAALRPAAAACGTGPGLRLAQRSRGRRAALTWPAWPPARAAVLRCMSTLPRKCAPSAIATRGDTMSPSTDPLSRMSTLSLAVTLPGHFAEHDDRLGEHLRLDSAVRSDRQHVIAQLNGPFDVAFDGQVFAAVQLALDDDRFSDVHDVFLHAVTRLRTKTGGPGRYRRGRLAAQPVGPLAGLTASSRFHM